MKRAVGLWVESDVDVQRLEHPLLQIMLGFSYHFEPTTCTCNKTDEHIHCMYIWSMFQLRTYEQNSLTDDSYTSWAILCVCIATYVMQHV